MKVKDIDNEQLIDDLVDAHVLCHPIFNSSKVLKKELLKRLEEGDRAVEAMKIVKEDLVEYLQHDSWRCGYHQKCHCGLDILTDKLGLERD